MAWPRRSPFWSGFHFPRPVRRSRTAGLEPLTEAINRGVKQGAAIFEVDTSIKILAPGRAGPKPGACGPMFVTSAAGAVRLRQLPATVSRRIARANTRRARISGKCPPAAAIRYALTRMKKLEPWLHHGITELDNNTAERAIRPLAVGRKNYLFVGSPSGGKSAAIAYTLIETAKLNDVDPQAWLTVVLANIADTKITHLEDLMPWSYAQRN